MICRGERSSLHNVRRDERSSLHNMLLVRTVYLVIYLLFFFNESAIII